MMRINRNIFLDAIGELDDRLLNEHFEEKEKLRGRAKKKKAPMHRRWGVIAACLCTVIIASAMATPTVMKKLPPKYEDAYFSASRVEKVFPSTDAISTNVYQEVYRPESRPPVIEPLPNDEYVNIYNIKSLSKELSRKELDDLGKNVLPRIAEAMAVSVGQLEKEESENQSAISFSYSYNEKKKIGLSQKGDSNTVTLYSRGEALTLGGRVVEIDQRQSEEEIIASLRWVRDVLSDIYSCSLLSSKVTFDYGANYNYGAENVYVYFYAETKDGRMGDYIRIAFDNYANTADEKVSADILTNCDIMYRSYRIPIDDLYEVEARCVLISLEEAEALLKSGYVFGGHSCSLCMKAQSKVKFDKYDYVGFTYISDGEISIPFYEFYKRIDVAKNGNVIYAKTYVCAIEVSGYEEYYEAQKSEHKQKFE